MELIKNIIPKELVQGITGYYAHGQNMSFGLVELKAGSSVPMHHHVHEQITYIVKDCGAKVVITSPKCADAIKGLVSNAPDAPLFFMIDEPLPGFRSWD